MANNLKEGFILGGKIAGGTLRFFGRGLFGTAPSIPDIPQQLPGQSRPLNIVLQTPDIMAPVGGSGGSDAVEILNTLRKMGAVDDGTAVELLAARLRQIGLRTEVEQRFLEEQHQRQQQAAFVEHVVENGPPLRPGPLKAVDIIRFHRVRRQVKQLVRGKRPNSSLIRSY